MPTNQPKQIVKDVFGELLETGKTTAKASGKAASDIASQAVKTISGHKTTGSQKSGSRDISGKLDWLDELSKGGESAMKSKANELSKESQADQQRKQIERMSEVDKKQSRQAYRQIQEEIEKLRKMKASQPRKYETGKDEFDEEQVKDPETFFEKMKKKQEEAKKNLPWNKKTPGGTGEMRRGVSG